MLPTLYQISEEQRRIEAMLEETGGELTPEIEEAMAINEGNFMEKSRDYGFAILRYKAYVNAIAEEKKRLDGLKKSAETAIERMSSRLLDAMQQFERPKVELDTIKLSVKKNPASVAIDDESKVPADCIKVKTEISKTDLKRHIEAGEDCGAHLEQGYSLSIR